MTVGMLGRVTASAIAIGGAEDILVSILDPAVQLALWRRERPAALDWIDALKWDAIDDINAPIAGPDFGTEIDRLLCDAGYPRTAQGRTLCDEIARFATRFAQIVDSRHLRLRLEVIETDACRKFHMDQLTARLLMALSGPGTQWIDTMLGEEAPINQLAVGEVGIFKGRLWVEEPAILHRSPPVAVSSEIRLLLVLDPIRKRA